MISGEGKGLGGGEGGKGSKSEKILGGKGLKISGGERP